MEWFELNWAWIVMLVAYIGLYFFGFGGLDSAGEYPQRSMGGNIGGKNGTQGHRH